MTHTFTTSTRTQVTPVQENVQQQFIVGGSRGSSTVQLAGPSTTLALAPSLGQDATRQHGRGRVQGCRLAHLGHQTELHKDRPRPPCAGNEHR